MLLATGVRTGVLNTLMPSVRNTSSNAMVNWLPRSRTRALALARMTCSGHQPLFRGTCIGSPHRVAPTISRGEPVRVERVASCGQLPLPLQTTSVAAGEVFAGLPDEVREFTLVLLARMIARAALEVGAADDGGLR